jgi:hypothetical protein
MKRKVVQSVGLADILNRILTGDIDNLFILQLNGGALRTAYIKDRTISELIDNNNDPELIFVEIIDKEE